LGYHDDCLKTAIGRKDGKAYETLFEWSSKSNQIKRIIRNTIKLFREKNLFNSKFFLEINIRL